jgi:transposase
MNQSQTSSIKKVRDFAAGIDIGSDEHWICVDPALTQNHIRRYRAFTDDLQDAVAWMLSLGIRSVAMEATGIYWNEFYTRIQEAGIEVILVDPRRTRIPRGRKTDMQDCRWIWELHANGMLDGAFIPTYEVQKLRTYLRFRGTRTDCAAKALQEIHRILSMMNIKLSNVLSDLNGKSGMAIIGAILNGERDPRVLAQLRDCRCKTDEETIMKALRGTWREEHLFLLRQAFTDYTNQTESIAACDKEIERLIASFPKQNEDSDDLKHKRSSGKHPFSFDAQKSAFEITGIDLTGIHGIGPHTALEILGEIGFDLKAWPTEKAFCCWLGLCPNPKRTGGKNRGSMPTTANRAANILKEAAFGLLGNKKNPLSKKMGQLAARLGKPAAIKAIAHKLARIVYAIFRDKSTYDPQKLIPPITEKMKTKMATRLAAKARELGYELKKIAVQPNAAQCIA